MLVGTGDSGKIFSLTPENELNHAVTLDESYITSLLPSTDRGVIATTAQLGKVYQFGPNLAEQGSYESDIIDAQTTAQWGAISWQHLRGRSNQVTVFTRSGNTERPNNTWSPWQAYSNHEGEQITNPAARFLQWKVEMKRSTNNTSPAISNIHIAYLQNNIAPEITQIRIHPHNQYYAPVSSGGRNNNITADAAVQRLGINRPLPLGNTEHRKGYCMVSWTFEDPNSDYVLFDIYYKRLSATVWHLLKKAHESNFISWDGQLMMDGEYQVRIIVSDSPSNPSNRALSTDKTSMVFILDNTAPAVEQVKFNRNNNALTFTVRDTWSNIERVEISINAQEWSELYSKDGILDSKIELFEFVPTLAAGLEHEIVIRVIDELGNIGFGNLLIKGD